jgi:hypothetical protein
LLQKGATFGLQREWVVTLKLLVEWGNLLIEVLWWEIVESVWCVGVTECDDERPIEISFAKYFKLVCKLVPLEVGPIRLLIQNV